MLLPASCKLLLPWLFEHAVSLDERRVFIDEIPRSAFGQRLPAVCYQCCAMGIHGSLQSIKSGTSTLEEQTAAQPLNRN
jgi:hypothetical protein